MSRKLLSALIPVYNDEKYLAETLDSVFSAISEKNRDLVELIIVDDGSLDKTAQILEEYCSKYNFILITQDNAGAYAAIRTMLKQATGEYFIIIDHDDLLEPIAIDEIVDYLQRHREIDMVLYDFFVFSQELSNKVLHIGGCDYCAEKLNGQAVFVSLNRKNLYSPMLWNKVINHRLAPAVFLNKSDEKYVIDIEIAPALYSVAKAIGYINKPLYNYRIHQNSMSRNTAYLSDGFCKSRLHALNSLNEIITGVTDLSEDFIETLHVEMSNIYMSAISGVRINGKFNEELLTKLKKYIGLLKYGKWDRRYIFTKLFGLKTLYILRFWQS